ncbi:MAG: GGDEF domain-containing protein [Candidatus Omnitrophica bacterium]|nr:GGDEF domain-containing protein [Candidatus Omnitrophota bacterium]
MEFIGIFLLLVFFAGFFWGPAVALFLAIGETLLFCLFCARTVRAPLHLLAPSGTIILATAVPLIYAKLREQFYEEISGRLEEIRASYEEFTEKDRQLRGVITQQEKEIVKLERIYEIAEKMSAALELKGSFEILTDILRRNFSFDTGYLALLEDQHEFAVKQILQIAPAKKTVHPSMAILEVMKKSFDTRTIITGDPRFSLRLSSELLSVKGTIVCMPFGVEKKIFGLVVLVGLGEEDFGRIGVIVNQFGLHMQRIQLYERVQQLALTDGLTGVYVRRHFRERLDEEMKRAKRRKTPLTLLMVDLDHFKSYNDQFGHLVGDVLLREVAGILNDNIREIDLVARYGGEEFSILLLDTALEHAILVAERIRSQTAKRTFRAYDETLTLTLSIGLAQFPLHADSEDELIEAADRALYQAKATGRNRVVVHSG